MKLAVVGSGYLAQTFRSWALLAGHELCEIQSADLVWFAEDTPVDENGVADIDILQVRFLDALDRADIPGIRELPILVSSQIPVGTTQRWSKRYGFPYLAYHPENIRSGHGVEDMLNQRRLVVGYLDDEAREAVTELFAPHPATILWMTPESAEMTKHALNAFLGMEIAFANEIAALCVKVGADYLAVERALRSDMRVGAQAYLRAGEPFAMEHLGRDLMYLSEVVDRSAGEIAPPLIPAILWSNEMHEARV